MPARAVTAARALVSIDGLDGSGKSRFARVLGAACEAADGAPVHVFHVDDFRRPLGALPPGADEGAVYYERYYDFELLDQSLRRFLEGAPGVSIPSFDGARERVEGERELRFGPARLALLEGVFVLRAPTAAASGLVLLEVTEDEARRRIIARDTARGRPLEVVEHRVANRYFPAQRAYRAAFDPVRRAHALVDNERWDNPRLLRLEAGRLPRLVEKVLATVVPP